MKIKRLSLLLFIAFVFSNVQAQFTTITPAAKSVVQNNMPVMSWTPAVLRPLRDNCKSKD